MKHLLILPLLLVAACGGGLDTHEGVIDAQIEVFNDMASVFRTVKDKQSAEAAKPKLLKLKERQKEIETAMEKLKGDPDPSLAMKKGAEASKASQNMMQAMMAIPNDPEVQRILDEVMR